MSTIKEVARRAGVSIATVSYVLNNSRTVKPETKEAVLKAARELNYIPNASARNLKVSDSKTIGFILPHLQDPMHAVIFNSISQYLQDRGYRLRLAFSNGSAELERHCIDDLISMNVNGLLLITCQPENNTYFKKQLFSRNVPVVFLERKPANLPCHFIGINNYKIAGQLTRELISKGYRDILLCCGGLMLSCESDSLNGYHDAIAEYKDDSIRSLVCITGQTKEYAFHDFLARYSTNPPQAIICTNRNIAKGIQVALHYNGLSSASDVLLIAFGEEAWDNMGNDAGLILTSRPAMQLGDLAAESIIDAVESPLSQDLIIRELDDTPTGITYHLPPAAMLHPRTIDRHISAGKQHRKLRVLITNLESTKAVNALSNHFSTETGIQMEYVVHPQETLMNRIQNSIHDPEDHFDIITYNAPWRDQLHELGVLQNLDTFTEMYHLDRKRFFTENLDNCMVDGKLYGIPFTAGGQILFYRKDLFQNDSLQKQFSQQHSISLRPPRTWNEFNHTAAFFTRSVNPDSPVEYGASFAGCDNEHLAPELLIRLSSFGGGLWNSYNQPIMHSTANENAFRSVLDTLQYVPPGYDRKKIADVVDDFSSGKTAMVIAFTEHAHSLSSALHEAMQTQVGSYHIPGHCPVRAGWNFGLNPASEQREEAYAFFNWLCQKNTSFYLTVLNGASPFIEPYRNYELQKIYPWLQYSSSSITHSICRNVPRRPNTTVIPTGELEGIICEAFRRVNDGTEDISVSLTRAQEEAIALYKAHGYPVSVNGFGQKRI